MEAKLLEYYWAKKDKQKQRKAFRGQMKKNKMLFNSILIFIKNSFLT